MSSLRFEGNDGRRRMIDLLIRSTLVGGDKGLAERFADAGELCGLSIGDKLIAEGNQDSDLYLILSGKSSGIDASKGVRVNYRGPSDHVGEISAADPSQPRSADVIVVENGHALKVGEPVLHEIALEKPEIWRRMLVEANSRLVQRNALVRPANGQPTVFIICSTEALEIAQFIQLALSYDNMLVTVWTDGVFRASEYPLESLMRPVMESDFAIAVIHSDDVVESRAERSMVPRDNVTFELGLFVGQLGKDRTVLVEPRGRKH